MTTNLTSIRALNFSIRSFNYVPPVDNQVVEWLINRKSDLNFWTIRKANWKSRKVNIPVTDFVTVTAHSIWKNNYSLFSKVERFNFVPKFTSVSITQLNWISGKLFIYYYLIMPGWCNFFSNKRINDFISWLAFLAKAKATRSSCTLEVRIVQRHCKVFEKAYDLSNCVMWSFRVFLML